MTKRLIRRSLSEYTDVPKIFSELISEIKKKDELEICLPIVDANIVSPALLEIKEISKNYGFNIKSSERGRLTFTFEGRYLPEDMALGFARDYFESSRHLFESVFNESMTLEFWKWKYSFYEKNVSPVITNNENVVAHYGLIPRKVCFGGDQLPAYQACDVMVSRKHRGKLGASLYKNIIDFGLMQFSSSATDTNSPALFFGFPHGRALKLGERLMEYTTLGNLYEVVFSRVDAAIKISNVVEENPSVLKEIWLNSWDRMLSENVGRVLGYRGWSYASRRYFTHPKHSYSYFVIGDKEKNILVTKRVTNETWLLVDFIGSIDKLAFQAMKLFQYLNIQHGCECLKLWQLESGANKFTGLAQVVRSNAALTAKFLNGGKGLEIEPWWIMMGDTDFL